MFAELFFHLLIDLVAKKEGAEAQRERVEPVFDAHIQTSLSFNIPEMADETRFQFADSASSCFFPSRVSE
jgi:hypothetical protein